MDSVLDKTGLSYFWGKIKAWVTNQGYTTNTGTITSVKMNGSTVASSGEADLGTVLTSFTETDPVFSASAAHGISASDITAWNAKQAALVSGTNIKTINNSSILGSGNLTIEGNAIFIQNVDCNNLVSGGKTITDSSIYTAINTAYQAGKVVYVKWQNSQMTPLIMPLVDTSNNTYLFTFALLSPYNNTSYFYNITVYSNSVEVTYAEETYATTTAVASKADKISIVSHGTSDTTFTLTPNIFHTWGTVTSLTLTLGTGTSYLDEYMFQFTSGSTATTLSLPNTVEWINGTPTIETSTTYQVSIVNNIAVIGGTA